jgi:drug/metabolite transporter (DMT)-like permease
LKQRDLVEYVILALVWGLSFVIVVKVVAAFGWAGAASFRALTAAIGLLALARIIGRHVNLRVDWRPLAVSGLFTVAGQLTGIAFASPLIGTAMTAIIVSAVPLFSMVVGRIAGLERLSLRSMTGLVTGFAGIVLLVGFPAAPMTPVFLLGCAVSILGSLSAACGSLYVSRRLKEADPWVVTIGSFLCGGLFILPLLLVEPVPAMPVAMDFVWLLLLGLVTSALMYVIFFRLLASIGASRTLSVEFAVTVVAVLAGTTMLGEQLSAIQLAGAAVIIAGCALVLGIGAPARGQKNT